MNNFISNPESACIFPSSLKDFLLTYCISKWQCDSSVSPVMSVSSLSIRYMLESMTWFSESVWKPHGFHRVNNTIQHNIPDCVPWLIPWRSLRSIQLKVHVKSCRHFILNPDLIWFFIVLQKQWGGVLACHTALFTWWQWILPLISMRVAMEISNFKAATLQRFLWKSAALSPCKRLCWMYLFFPIILLSELILNYYHSIHVYQENPIQPLGVHNSFQCVVYVCSKWSNGLKWMDFQIIFQPMHSGSNIESLAIYIVSL